MKYTIETNENGYTETLEICGKVFKKTWKKTGVFYRCEEGDFTDRVLQDKDIPSWIDGDDLYNAVDDDYVNGVDLFKFERDYLRED